MSKRFRVAVNTIPLVRDFVIINNMTDSVIDVHHGHYIIDGKSLLGIFSLPLLKPLDVEIMGDDWESIVSQYKEKNIEVEEVL